MIAAVKAKILLFVHMIMLEYLRCSVGLITPICLKSYLSMDHITLGFLFSVFSWIFNENFRLIDWCWLVLQVGGQAASTIRLKFWIKFCFLKITQMFLIGID